MLKKTLYFSNPAYLSKKQKQLVIKMEGMTDARGLPGPRTIPLEDIGMVVLDNPQITLSHGLISELSKEGAVVVSCDEKHLPNGMLLPMNGSHVQSQRWRAQLEATKELKDRLWKQTVEAKIQNQLLHLRERESVMGKMVYYKQNVQDGDSANAEGQAAAFYWKHIFPELDSFQRDRLGTPPNQLLNYGYAILRALTARCLAGSGLLVTLGIHHQNKYNSYCLADDIMEPYRPVVDRIVAAMISNGEDFTELNTDAKKQLLGVMTSDIKIGRQKSVVSRAMQRTCLSLANVFTGAGRKILYPVLY